MKAKEIENVTLCQLVINYCVAEDLADFIFRVVLDLDYTEDKGNKFLRNVDN